MTDQAIINLKKKLDALSSKSSKGKIAPKSEEVPKQAPQHQMQSFPPLQPLPTQKKSVLGELSPEEIRNLKAQLGFPEQQEVPQEMEEVEEEDEEEPIEPEPSEEDLEQFKRIQIEIARLQNAGAFRVEVLYQYLGINANLNRIATALEKLTNGKR
jgi:hypothetical protein